MAVTVYFTWLREQKAKGNEGYYVVYSDSQDALNAVGESFAQGFNYCTNPRVKSFMSSETDLKAAVWSALAQSEQNRPSGVPASIRPTLIQYQAGKTLTALLSQAKPPAAALELPPLPPLSTSAFSLGASSTSVGAAPQPSAQQAYLNQHSLTHQHSKPPMFRVPPPLHQQPFRGPRVEEVLSEEEEADNSHQYGLSDHNLPLHLRERANTNSAGFPFNSLPSFTMNEQLKLKQHHPKRQMRIAKFKRDHAALPETTATSLTFSDASEEQRRVDPSEPDENIFRQICETPYRIDEKQYRLKEPDLIDKTWWAEISQIKQNGQESKVGDLQYEKVEGAQVLAAMMNNQNENPLEHIAVAMIRIAEARGHRRVTVAMPEEEFQQFQEVFDKHNLGEPPLTLMRKDPAPAPRSTTPLSSW